MERPYSHHFERYFELDGVTYDRIPLIERHGIVSESTARRLGIPYAKRSKNWIYPISEEMRERLIFVHDWRIRKIETGSVDAVCLINEDIQAMSLAQLQELCPDMTSFSEGEKYVLDQIERSKFEIRIFKS